MDSSASSSTSTLDNNVSDTDTNGKESEDNSDNMSGAIFDTSDEDNETDKADEVEEVAQNPSIAFKGLFWKHETEIYHFENFDRRVFGFWEKGGGGGVGKQETKANIDFI